MRTEIGAAVPGAPGWHYVLTYNDFNQYMGTSQQYFPPTAPVQTGTGAMTGGGQFPGGLTTVDAGTYQAVNISLSMQVGVAFNRQVDGLGNIIPGTGAPPPGINYGSGYFAGTPTTAGTYTFITLSASGLTKTTCTIYVSPPPALPGPGPVTPVTTTQTASFSMQVGVAVNVQSSPGTFAGTLPPGINFTGGHFVGTPTAAGKYSVTIMVSATLQILCNFTVTAAAVAVTVQTMDWDHAEAAARSGSKIRRIGWGGKYIEYDPQNYVFWMQFFDSATKVLGLRHVVQAPEFTPDEFNALDWVVLNITSDSSLTVTTGSTVQGFAADGFFYIGAHSRLVPLETSPFGFRAEVKDGSGMWVPQVDYTQP